MLNLDTHILVRALNGELRPSERSLLARDKWSPSAIVIAEVAQLVQLGRVDIDLNDREVVRTMNRVQGWPIDLAVAIASNRLDFRAIRRTSSLPRPVSCTTCRSSGGLRDQTAPSGVRVSSRWTGSPDISCALERLAVND